ncbi:phage tail terminator protein [Nocardia testacea]|uniref:phage tail terminator protein n=1 Tax=Nocardia testacea TaxID=248551 RepID=UPI0002F4ED44|nr:minor capsid protein [Nocardia testacea]
MIDPGEFLEALARHLDAAGLARYIPAGAYPPGTVPAATFSLLPSKPDAAVALTVYDEVLDRDDHNPDVYVQMRWRAAGIDPRVVNASADAATRQLHDATHIQLPDGPRVLLCRRKIRGLATPDSNGRYERADSYVFTLNPAPAGGTL